MLEFHGCSMCLALSRRVADIWLPEKVFQAVTPTAVRLRIVFLAKVRTEPNWQSPLTILVG